MDLRLPLACLLAALAALVPAATAAAAAAPGRVVFPFEPGPRDDADTSALKTGAELADGRLVVAGEGAGATLIVARLQRDGALDPTFGTGGKARIRLSAEVLQVLARPDGRILVIASTSSVSESKSSRMVVAGLTPDGRPDPAFGEGGLARPDIRVSCTLCPPAALLADGALALTGNTSAGWVTARLTPSGSLDARYGRGGIAELPGEGGYAVAALPGGALAVAGSDARGPKVARLAPDGSLDPGFNGGTPAIPPFTAPLSYGILGRPDGGFDVLGVAEGAARIARFSARGELDPDYTQRSAGRLPTGPLAPAPDGGTLVTGGAPGPALAVARLAPDGQVVRSGQIELPFGGGIASLMVVSRPPEVAPLDQNGFNAGRPFARRDGSVVVPGGVGVLLQEVGEAQEGRSAEEAAVAAYTPELALDEAFGGPARKPPLSVRVPSQRAAAVTGRYRRAVKVTLRTAGPGLALLRVRARGRTVARSTAPVFRTGTNRVSALLTLRGRRALRGARGARITVTATFRDLLAETTTETATGRLR